ncbi:MAG: four-carbon acid sugar kinase family protein [Anaerolineae bacterium]
MNLKEMFESLPPEWPADLLADIRELVHESRRKIVVLDDDPTGTQTVHDVPVLTGWSVEALCAELESDLPAFYILTNSRSLSLAEAVALNTTVGRNLLEARYRSGREFVVVSRSDSTLRGHFPGEVKALAQALQQQFDAWLIIPFFLEGGRYTVHDVHYVAEGEQLVPAGETEFARDVVFGYHASNLREWVEEKTRGDVRASDVASISIDDLRLGGPDRVTEQLTALRNGNICIVNAASMRDLQVFVLGLLRAEALGKRFLYRTAASFVQVRAGLAPHPLLQRSDFDLSFGSGGLIVVGSYVPRTTAQIRTLISRSDICSLEVAVEALLDDEHWQQETKRLARQADQLLRSGCNVMLYTSRQLVTGANAEHSLNIGRRVSEGLVSIVRAISARPRYLVAKGGITSSDVATYGLDVKRAMVMGQILPGVPVWRLGPESRFPGLAYVVFPGNVGDAQSLLRVVQMLSYDEE